MPPSNCFRTGRRSLTQSSVKAVHGQDSKWMSGSVYHRNRRREARTRAEGPEKPVSRAPPERVRRALALLTRTHHGCRLLGTYRGTMRLGLSKPGYHRCSISGQTPDILRFLVSQEVAVAVVHQHTKIRGSRRIPAILDLNDFSGPISQIQAQGTLVRFVSGIALHMEDLFTHRPVFLCGFPPALRSRPRPEKQSPRKAASR